MAQTVEEPKLVIEVKLDYQNPSSEELSHDEKKLVYFTDQNNEYKYIIGAHIVLGKEFFTIKYYENGRLKGTERHDLSNPTAFYSE